jgi:hypothetical protein
VDAHHIVHWADGGETTLANLVQLCTGHHKAMHEYGFGVSRSDAGELVFRDPRGRLVTNTTPIRSRTSTAIDRAVWARTTRKAPGWDGIPVQWECCVDALVSASP